MFAPAPKYVRFVPRSLAGDVGTGVLTAVRKSDDIDSETQPHVTNVDLYIAAEDVLGDKYQGFRLVRPDGTTIPENLEAPRVPEVGVVYVEPLGDTRNYARTPMDAHSRHRREYYARSNAVRRQIEQVQRQRDGVVHELRALEAQMQRLYNEYEALEAQLNHLAEQRRAALSTNAGGRKRRGSGRRSASRSRAFRR